MLGSSAQCRLRLPDDAFCRSVVGGASLTIEYSDYRVAVNIRTRC